MGSATQVAGIERSEALRLFQKAPLPDLLAEASRLRWQGKGGIITFSKKVFIPLTTLCRDYCGYCTFRKDPGQPGAHFMTPEEVIALSEAGRRAGCKEALFSLGDQPERIFPEARAFLTKQGFAGTLEHLKECNASVGLMLESVSTRLMRHGLAHAKAPDKVPALRLRTMEEAGKLGMAFTTGILIGIGETAEERIDSLFAIREMQARYGHIQEVIVQNFRSKPDIPMAESAEPTLEDMLRTLAIARIILGPEMNLQAPPNLSYEDFPRLLEAGINDWGGISPVTRDFINPEAAWPQIARLRAETEARGFVLRERLAAYPEYVRRDAFLAPRVRAQALAMADSAGYAA